MASTTLQRMSEMLDATAQQLERAAAGELATRYAHEELDLLVAQPSTTPLLVELVNHIALRLT